MRSKGHVSALLLMSCFGVVYFKVDVFKKEYNNVNFMGNDLERRLYDTSVSYVEKFKMYPVFDEEAVLASVCILYPVCSLQSAFYT